MGTVLSNIELSDADVYVDKQAPPSNAPCAYQKKVAGQPQDDAAHELSLPDNSLCPHSLPE